VFFSPHYPWYFLWLIPFLCFFPWPSVSWLTLSATLLYRVNWPPSLIGLSVQYVPFAILLAAIALAPLLAPQWWLRHYPKVAFGLGSITVAYYLISLRAYSELLHVAHEYASFILLIGSLYIVSGGIHINVRGEARPGMNVLFLFIGAVLANVLGTTGASMLLIRPWIRMNRYRVAAYHIVVAQHFVLHAELVKNGFVGLHLVGPVRR